MSAYFFDSSALVKRYARETGTTWIIGLLKPSSGNAIFMAQITSVEVVAALTRQTKAGRLTTPKLDKHILRFERSLQGRYIFVDVEPSLLTVARQLARQHGLRGYDAVQLAAALNVHNRRQLRGLPPVTLISADSELNDAAQAEGLPVDDPNNHP